MLLLPLSGGQVLVMGGHAESAGVSEVSAGAVAAAVGAQAEEEQEQGLNEETAAAGASDVVTATLRAAALRAISP